MALQEYAVTQPDGRVLTFKLDEAHAARYGDAAKPVQRQVEVAEKAAPKPANKARTARNK